MPGSNIDVLLRTKPDQTRITNMAEYLNTWLRTKIHDTRTLLMEITPKTPSQEIAHGRYIRRLNVLELYGNTDPLDTKTIYKDDTNAIEFKDFKASIFNIEHETSTPQSTCSPHAHRKHSTSRPPCPGVSNHTPRPV